MLWALVPRMKALTGRAFHVQKNASWGQEFQALSQLRAVEPHELVLRAKVLSNLGQCYLATEEYQQAEVYYSEAYDLFASTVGKRSPLFGMQAWACGNLRFAEGRHAAALPLLGEALYVEVVADGLSVSEMMKLLDQILHSMNELRSEDSPSLQVHLGPVRRALNELIEDPRWDELDKTLDLAVLSHKMALVYVVARWPEMGDRKAAEYFNLKAVSVLNDLQHTGSQEAKRWLLQAEAVHSAHGVGRACPYFTLPLPSMDSEPGSFISALLLAPSATDAAPSHIAPTEGWDPEAEPKPEPAVEQTLAIEDAGRPEPETRVVLHANAKKLVRCRERLKDKDMQGILSKMDEELVYEEVDFSSNELTSASMGVVAEICRRSRRQLKVLKLFRNRIDEGCVPHFSELLKHCAELREIHLSHNCLSYNCVIDLAACATQHRRGFKLPLWLRVEQNSFGPPGQLLRDLESRFKVCPRKPSCSQFHCAYGCVLHMPFLGTVGKDFGKDQRNDYGKDYGTSYSKDYRTDSSKSYGGSGRDYGKDYNKDYSRDYGKDSNKDYSKDYNIRNHNGHDNNYTNDASKNQNYGKDHSKDYSRDYGKDFSRDRGNDYKEPSARQASRPIFGSPVFGSSALESPAFGSPQMLPRAAPSSIPVKPPSPPPRPIRLEEARSRSRVGTRHDRSRRPAPPRPPSRRRTSRDRRRRSHSVDAHRAVRHRDRKRHDSRKRHRKDISKSADRRRSPRRLKQRSPLQRSAGDTREPVQEALPRRRQNDVAKAPKAASPTRPPGNWTGPLSDEELWNRLDRLSRLDLDGRDKMSHGEQDEGEFVVVVVVVLVVVTIVTVVSAVRDVVIVVPCHSRRCRRRSGSRCRRCVVVVIFVVVVVIVAVVVVVVFVVVGVLMCCDDDAADDADDAYGNDDDVGDDDATLDACCSVGSLQRPVVFPRAPKTGQDKTGRTKDEMLTISISESLAGNPEGWSEWSGDTKKYLSGLDAQLAAPGGPTGYAHAWNEDAEPRPWNETTSAMSSPWPMSQLPQHLPEAMPAPPAPSMPMRAMPASSWASPLRVPLPEPIINKYDKPLAGDEPLELPPHLSTMIEQFATVDPTPWQEEAPKRFQPPPGLAAEQSLAGPRVAKSVVPVATELDLPPGIKIFGVDYAGSMCTRVEWRIDDLNGKLQASMGRPLVSPPFAALGLPNLRLMVFPDGRETMKNARSSERKGLYTQMIKKGPLHGSLKLKADCLQCATVMTVNLLVGQVRAGPLVYDFSEQAIHGLEDLGVDWLKQVDKSNGSLTVGIEILDVRPQP
eukprot:s1620_g8.t1